MLRDQAERGPVRILTLVCSFERGSTLEDGAPIEVSECMIYRGCMLSRVPNFCFGFGYTNASWTLKAHAPPLTPLAHETLLERERLGRLRPSLH